MEKDSLSKEEIVAIKKDAGNHEIRFVKRSKIKEKYIDKYINNTGNLIWLKTTETYTPVTLKGFGEDKQRTIILVTTK